MDPAAPFGPAPVGGDIDALRRFDSPSPTSGNDDPIADLIYACTHLNGDLDSSLSVDSNGSIASYA